MPGELVPIVFFISAAAFGIFFPLARAYARSIEKRSSHGLPPGVHERLERMEHALDAMAIEIERISEGQRFTTRLLSERADAARLAPPDDR